MMKNILRLLIIAIIVAGCSVEPPVTIIFDTDFGGDADDLAALAMLHNLADDKGVNTWTPMEGSTHSYLKLSIPVDEMVKLIEGIMLNEL